MPTWHPRVRQPAAGQRVLGGLACRSLIDTHPAHLEFTAGHTPHTARCQRSTMSSSASKPSSRSWRRCAARSQSCRVSRTIRCAALACVAAAARGCSASRPPHPQRRRPHDVPKCNASRAHCCAPRAPQAAPPAPPPAPPPPPPPAKEEIPMEGFDDEQQELIKSLLKKRDELLRMQQAIQQLQGAEEGTAEAAPPTPPPEPEPEEEEDDDEDVGDSAVSRAPPPRPFPQRRKAPRRPRSQGGAVHLRQLPLSSERTRWTRRPPLATSSSSSSSRTAAAEHPRCGAPCALCRPARFPGLLPFLRPTACPFAAAFLSVSRFIGLRTDGGHPCDSDGQAAGAHAHAPGHLRAS